MKTPQQVSRPRQPRVACGPRRPIRLPGARVGSRHKRDGRTARDSRPGIHRPQRSILSCYPTYILYETLALLHGARPVLVDLDDDFCSPNSFSRPPRALCFLSRPNSPSGVAVSVQEWTGFAACSTGWWLSTKPMSTFPTTTASTLPRSSTTRSWQERCRNRSAWRPARWLWIRSPASSPNS